MNNETMKNKTISSGRSYFAVLYKNLLFIILSAILGALIGFGTGIITVKPVYTKSMSVMLLAEVDATEESASNSQDMALSQYWLGDVNKILKSSNFVTFANEYYESENGSGSIEAGSISITYNSDQSLIFSISYTDLSYELAEAKLKSVISRAKIYLQDKLVADNVELKETSNVYGQSMKYNYTSYIIVGLFVGVLISVGYVTIKHLLDNTLKDKDEIEELTGTNLLACIESISDETLSKQRKKKKTK